MDDRRRRRGPREAMGEALRRIVVASDMQAQNPLDYSVANHLALTRRLPHIARLYPIRPREPLAQTVPASIKRGAWVVPCPFCLGQEYADPDYPQFLCCSCWNQDVGGRSLVVEFPPPTERAVIEARLLERDEPRHRNWEPGMSQQDMDADWERLRREGTPTDRSTSDLITAAIWNAAIGASGDLHQLWVHHDHATALGAGDGAELGGFLHGYEYASGSGISITKNSWATICTVSFTPALATDLFVMLGSAYLHQNGTSGGDLRAIIDRTSGSGGTIVQPTSSMTTAPATHTLTPVALYIPADTTGQGFSLRGFQNSDDGGNTSDNSGTLVVLRLRAPGTSI